MQDGKTPPTDCATVVVLGLGVTGLSCARYLSDQGARVLVGDVAEPARGLLHAPARQVRDVGVAGESARGRIGGHACCRADVSEGCAACASHVVPWNLNVYAHSLAVGFLPVKRAASTGRRRMERCVPSA